MELNDSDIVVGPYFAESNGMYLTDENRLYDSDYIPYIVAGVGIKSTSNIQSSFNYWNAESYLLFRPDTNELWYIDSKSLTTTTNKKFKLDVKEYQPIIDKLLKEEASLYEFPDFANIWTTLTTNNSGTATITTSPTTSGSPLIWQNNNCTWTTTNTTYPITWASSTTSGSYFNYNTT